jgi:hypothetical protein
MGKLTTDSGADRKTFFRTHGFGPVNASETMVARMEKMGLLYTESGGRAKYVFPILPRGDAVRMKTRVFSRKSLRRKTRTAGDARLAESGDFSKRGDRRALSDHKGSEGKNTMTEWIISFLRADHNCDHPEIYSERQNPSRHAGRLMGILCAFAPADLALAFFRARYA